MSIAPVFCTNQANAVQIAAHLHACDHAFIPPLSERVIIGDYAHKITDRAVRFEAWADELFVGLLAAYCSDNQSRVGFITSVSVLPGWQGQGIASQLIEKCIEHARGLGLAGIELEVDIDNRAAIRLYEKYNFSTDKTCRKSAIMYLAIG